MEPSDEPDERLLNEVFGDLSITRQQIRQPDAAWSEADVQLSELVSVAVHVFTHPGHESVAIVPHATRTRKCPDPWHVLPRTRPSCLPPPRWPPVYA